MKCYVFVTGGEFDRYRRPGVDTRYLGGRQSDSKVTGICGSNRIRYKVFQDGDGLVVIIDGAGGSLNSKSEVRKRLSPQADANDISEFLSSYLSDVKAVIEECARCKDPAEVTLFTHWGGGMPQDVSAIERIVQKSLAECFSSPYGEWNAYSISSVRTEVFDISRGEIQIPDLKECAEIESRAEVYGGVRDWLNALALVCASDNPQSLAGLLRKFHIDHERVVYHGGDVMQRIDRLKSNATLEDVRTFMRWLIEAAMNGDEDRLVRIVKEKGNVRCVDNSILRERCAAYLSQIVNGGN